MGCQLAHYLLLSPSTRLQSAEDLEAPLVYKPLNATLLML
jgi:hypothetical protein